MVWIPTYYLWKHYVNTEMMNVSLSHRSWAQDDGGLEFVFPYGATLNAQKPAVPILSSGPGFRGIRPVQTWVRSGCLKKKKHEPKMMTQRKFGTWFLVEFGAFGYVWVVRTWGFSQKLRTHLAPGPSPIHWIVQWVQCTARRLDSFGWDDFLWKWCNSCTIQHIPKFNDNDDNELLLNCYHLFVL